MTRELLERGQVIGVVTEEIEEKEIEVTRMLPGKVLRVLRSGEGAIQALEVDMGDMIAGNYHRGIQFTLGGDFERLLGETIPER